MLGDSIVMPVKSYTTKFKDEFRQRIEEALEGKKVERQGLNAKFASSH
jgi:hypothetical protein